MPYVAAATRENEPPMTCEIAVMNKYGVALAADSAATFGRGQKVYQAAEKLFQISQSPPVGMMVSGAAELMDMPWEIVIKNYIQRADGRRFERLEQYADDFFRFVEESAALFPASLQETWFRESVRRYWKDTFLEPLAAKPGRRAKATPKRAALILSRTIARENANWRQLPTLDLGADYGDKIITQYAAVLTELEKELFRPFDLPAGFAEKFRAAVRSMYMRSWFHPDDETGIVLAGMGETEPFPMLQEYQVGTIAAGRLRFAKLGEARVTRDVSAIVAPFGVTEMVDIFYRGIQPALEDTLYEIIGRSLAHDQRHVRRKLTAAQIDKIVDQIRKSFTDEIVRKYQSPLISAVEALPRQGLATMAEALVNLTALKLRMSVETLETVGGAINVAVLSKGDGFIWIKRPNALREAVASPVISAP
jgi:hypothetical protein